MIASKICDWLLVVTPAVIDKKSRPLIYKSRIQTASAVQTSKHHFFAQDEVSIKPDLSEPLSTFSPPSPRTQMATPVIPSDVLKQLVSSNPRARTTALDDVRRLISTPSRCFSPTELLGPWKGLFFTMWHADRPITQQRLAADLASLTFSLAAANVMAWLEAFWRTIAREWKGIDALRMDKFLLLVRRYLAAGFEWCKRSGWGDAEVEAVVEVIGKIPLCPSGGSLSVPDGLRYHVLDIYVDELERVGHEAKMPVKELLKPVKALMGAKTTHKIMKKRIVESLEDERLTEWTKEAGGENVAKEDVEGKDGVDVEEDDDEWSGIDD